MTIAFQGHVEKLERGAGDTIIYIHGDSTVCDETIVVRAPSAIAEKYHPGVAVSVTIYPLVK